MLGPHPRVSLTRERGATPRRWNREKRSDSSRRPRACAHRCRRSQQDCVGSRASSGAPGSSPEAAGASSSQPRHRRTQRGRRRRVPRGRARACATSVARRGGRRSRGRPGVDGGDRLFGEQPRRHQLRRPQAQDVAVGALDLLADDDIDAVAVRDRGRFERALVGVVVADGDDREVGRLRRPLQHIGGRGGPVGGGGVDVEVGGRVMWSHGVRIVALRRGDRCVHSLRPGQRASRKVCDVRTDDFDYDLPTGLIAQHPAEPRDSCRLLVVDRRERADRSPHLRGPRRVPRCR